MLFRLGVQPDMGGSRSKKRRHRTNVDAVQKIVCLRVGGDHLEADVT